MSTQPGHAFGIELVESPGSGLCVHYKSRVFENAQVLRNRGPADRHDPGQFVYGNGTGRELLKDRHAGGVPEGVESGLEVSVH